MTKNNLKELFNLFDGILPKEEIKTTELLARISSRIVKYRLDNNMTQKEFAALLEITQSMVSKIESEEYNFTVGKLVEICTKLGLDIDVKIQSPEEKMKSETKYVTKETYVIGADEIKTPYMAMTDFDFTYSTVTPLN